MILRHDRRRGPPLAQGPTSSPGGFTAAGVGRLLGRERTRQGLSLPDVSRRTGIALDRLRAAEIGALDGIDGLATLTTVRRYADFLGLPGDRYALGILDRWPTRSAARAARSASLPGPPAADLHRSAPADFEPAPAYGHTGMTPAVPAVRSQVWSRPRHHGATALLQVLVGFVALALVAGVALLAIDRLHPAWLREAGLAPPADPTLAAAPAPAGAQTGAGAHTGERRGATLLEAHRSSATTAAFDVPAARFTVTVAAAGGPCWVDVTAHATQAPLYAGVVDPGSPRSFSGRTPLVVELGSVAGRVSVSAPGVRSASYAPPAIPFNVTVTGHA